MRPILPVILASVLVVPLLGAAETPASEAADIPRDWDRDFYICQAFDDEGFMVAMQMARDEGLARIKTWEICYRNRLDCWLVQCYEQF